MLEPQPCEVCGSTVRVVAHHDDYSKPLEIRWLCRSHHGLLHAELSRQGTPITATDKEKQRAHAKVQQAKPSKYDTDLQRRLGLHDNDWERLESLAAANDRTVAAEIRRAIRSHVEAAQQAAAHSPGSLEEVA